MRPSRTGAEPSTKRPSRTAWAAAWLEEAFVSGAPLARLPDDLRPRTAAEGYRAQARLVAALGIPVGGWKIGCTSAAARAILGARGPFAGRVLAPRILASGAALPGRALRTRGLEPEIAVTLARDLPPRAEPYGTAEVADAIATFHPAIEVVEPRWDRWLEVGVPSVIADLGANGWLVLGEGTAPAALGDPLAVTVRMTVDGTAPVEGGAAAVDGGPVGALTWLANHLRRSEGLRVGEVVSTGTCAGFVQAPAEAAATARFEGLGTVSLRFV
jgi:2-keto-4-pentenoate hydratase